MTSTRMLRNFTTINISHELSDKLEEERDRLKLKSKAAVIHRLIRRLKS